MPRESDFRQTLTTLWFRFITLTIVSCVTYEALYLARGKAQGWSFYLSGIEVTFELIVRLVAASLLGLTLGTIAAGVLVPVLWFVKSPRKRFADWVIRWSVIGVLFVVIRYMVITAVQWSGQSFREGDGHVRIWLALYYVVFAIAVLVPKSRTEIASSLDHLLAPRMTRRTALVTVAGTVGLAATEYLLSKRIPTVRAAEKGPRPNKNIVLISFDALAAEDMELYGHALPTTPNIDAFAKDSTVFTRYFSAYTFTTPSVAAMMTGLFPSESKVYQIQGGVHNSAIRESLPRQLREAGYKTGAFVTNPYAYYFAKELRDFDVYPEPVFQAGGLQGLWDITTPIHQDSGIGSRVEEYWDMQRAWNNVARLSIYLPFEYRPATTFEQAQKIISTMPDGFFVWVHLISPHFPYRPGAQDQGRFLPVAEQRTFESDMEEQWQPHYPPEVQPQVDRRRLLYDEYVATADRAFGSFMSNFEKSGRMDNTSVIVTADHGESFEGGVYEHSTAYLTRPVIHVPLILRTPGQRDGGKINFTADQTSLVPTILDLAGQPKPHWMSGESLVPWLARNGEGAGQGRAFTQYLAKNSVFKPLQHGTVGVIEGDYQYVVYLDSQKGVLRPLDQAQIWNLDKSAEYPAKAQELRNELRTRFPDLIRQ